ncbi:hypothetical protein [Klebsiella pneumoniae]|uniref:hypothetical protein n=1 Tax=Klebsiella pneumoniae TaxID=573 RepID=UPI001F4AAF4C|nr:hypothetical protein [Klebsiella pneumoniae]HBW3346615.1 hypothetical protein [Klebsiella pneumoniae]
MNNDGLTLNQLAERNAVLVAEIEKLRAEFKQLAVENMALKKSERELDKTCAQEFGQDWVSVLTETPATDAYLAGLKADALPDNIAEIIDSGDLETICWQHEHYKAEDYRLALYRFRTVREGADK